MTIIQNKLEYFFLASHDIQLNDIQHNDTQHKH
jgi:hypothetical protein